VEQWHLIQRLASGVLRRRKRLCALCLVLSVAILAPIAFYGSKEPPRYRTSAVILLEARPDRVPIFQEFSPFRPLPVQLAILQSRSLAEAVIESLPRASVDDLIQNPYYTDYVLTLKNAYRRLVGAEPEVQSPQARALKELQQGRIDFDPTRDGIVKVTATASRPQVAIDIANTYIEVLLSRTRSFNVDDARTSREFLEQQLADVKKSLTANEDALRAFNSAHGGVRVPERSQTQVAELSQAETSLSEVAASRKMMEARLKALRQKMEHQPVPAAPAPGPSVAVAPPSAKPAPPEVRHIRDQLAKLEALQLELRTKFTDEHPRVLVTKSHISELQRQLALAVKETTTVEPAPNAVPRVERSNFTEQVLALETALHSIVAQEEALTTQVAGLRRSLSGLSKSEVEYSRLTRDVDSTRTLNALLSDKLTAARIREQGEMKVVKIIDPPGPATSVVAGDKRVKLLLTALLLSVVLSVGGPVGVEWAYRKVENERDVETTVGLPVMAMVPRMTSGRPIFNGGLTVTHPIHQAEDFMFTEAIRGLRVGVQLAGRPAGLRTVMIASPLPHEGKSTMLLNLGLAFQEAGVRVVLADTDFLRPTLQRTLSLHQQGDVSDAIRERLEENGGIESSLREDRAVHQALVPAGEGMWVAPLGDPIDPRSRGMLATSRLNDLVEDMAGQADLVLCDSAPVLLVPDNLFLASAVDAVLLVAKAGSTGCRDLARAKTLLDSVGARCLGVVINEIPVAALKRSYRRYYQAYAKNGQGGKG